MGSTEQSINEEEVFDRTCGRNVQKKPIYRRGPGDSGMTLRLLPEKFPPETPHNVARFGFAMIFFMFNYDLIRIFIHGVSYVSYVSVLSLG